MTLLNFESYLYSQIQKAKKKQQAGYELIHGPHIKHWKKIQTPIQKPLAYEGGEELDLGGLEKYIKKEDVPKVNTFSSTASDFFKVAKPVVLTTLRVHLINLLPAGALINFTYSSYKLARAMKGTWKQLETQARIDNPSFDQQKSMTKFNMVLDQFKKIDKSKLLKYTCFALAAGIATKITLGVASNAMHLMAVNNDINNFSDLFKHETGITVDSPSLADRLQHSEQIRENFKSATQTALAVSHEIKDFKSVMEHDAVTMSLQPSEAGGGDYWTMTKELVVDNGHPNALSHEMFHAYDDLKNGGLAHVDNVYANSTIHNTMFDIAKHKLDYDLKNGTLTGDEYNKWVNYLNSPSESRARLFSTYMNYKYPQLNGAESQLFADKNFNTEKLVNNLIKLENISDPKAEPLDVNLTDSGGKFEEIPLQETSLAYGLLTNDYDEEGQRNARI